MNHFTIRFANKEILGYETELTAEEFTQYLANNEFFTIDNKKDVVYCTNSIVSITDSTEWFNKEKEQASKRKLILDEILKYKFNRRFKLWFNFWIKGAYSSETIAKLDFGLSTLEEMLAKCKKYKCEKKTS